MVDAVVDIEVMQADREVKPRVPGVDDIVEVADALVFELHIEDELYLLPGFVADRHILHRGDAFALQHHAFRVAIPGVIGHHGHRFRPLGQRNYLRRKGIEGKGINDHAATIVENHRALPLPACRGDVLEAQFRYARKVCIIADFRSDFRSEGFRMPALVDILIRFRVVNRVRLECRRAGELERDKVIRRCK